MHDLRNTKFFEHPPVPLRWVEEVLPAGLDVVANFRKAGTEKSFFTLVIFWR